MRARYPNDVRGTVAREKSIAIYQDMIYFAAPDGFLVAIDAKTGKQRWESKLDNGGQQAGGLLVADGKVISNRTCEQGKRENCFIAANDAMTGELVWKFFTTAAPGEPGGDTWGNVPVEPARRGSLGPGRLLRSQPQDSLLERRQSQSLYAADAPWRGRRGFAHRAGRSLQQFDAGAQRRDRQAQLVLPGTAGR